MSHAPLTRKYVSVELEDGTVHEDLRIVIKDVLAYMKTARINNWDTEDGMAQLMFTAWHNGKRTGLWDCTYEDFRDKQLVDLDTVTAPVDEDTTEDPTPAS